MPKKSQKKVFTLSCKNIGSEDCGFSVTTHSTDEVKKAMFAHARYAHPEKLSNMTESQKHEMAKMIDTLVNKQK